MHIRVTEDSANMKSVKNVKSKRIISQLLEMLLRILGIWPGVPYNLYLKVFWLTLIICNTSFQYHFLMFHASSRGFLAFTYVFAVALTMTTKLIKLVIFWCNQRKFNEMWETMSVNWERGNALAATVNRVNKTQVSHYLPNFIVIFHMCSVMMTSSRTILGGINYDASSNTTRPFILPIHYPFDNTSHFLYLLILFQQFFYLLIFAAGTTALNSILIILMLYLGDQIDIICRCMTEMPSATNKHEANKIIIKEMIKKHQSIIIFSKNVESIYTYITLLLFVPNTLITCGLAFIFVMSIGSKIFVKTVTKNLMFFCVTNIETFVFCFAGEYLSAKSKVIGEAAYSSPWYHSKFHGHAVLFMILRSQRQLTITVGKFTDLSLELFSTIVKASMSYLSVLLAMY